MPSYINVIANNESLIILEFRSIYDRGFILISGGRRVQCQYQNRQHGRSNAFQQNRRTLEKLESLGTIAAQIMLRPLEYLEYYGLIYGTKGFKGALNWAGGIRTGSTAGPMQCIQETSVSRYHGGPNNGHSENLIIIF